MLLTYLLFVTYYNPVFFKKINDEVTCKIVKCLILVNESCFDLLTIVY